MESVAEYTADFNVVANHMPNTRITNADRSFGRYPMNAAIPSEIIGMSMTSEMAIKKTSMTNQ